jgi:FAD:protein FMN transferase
MACTFELFLRASDRAHIQAAERALRAVDALEAQLSIFRDDSELSAINRTAHEGFVRVEPRLYALLCVARGVGRETGGAYDVTTGAVSRCWGFLRREAAVPSAEALAAARACAGWDLVTFDDAQQAVRFARPGMELNLGSIGKGFALERVADRLRDAGLADFLLHAGHSSVLAAGDPGSGRGWPVAVRDPRAGGRQLGVVHLFERALSVSGSGEQHVEHEGQRLGHVLDPRSGWPVEGRPLTVVTASRASVAEAFSTAFLVMEDADVRACLDLRTDLGWLGVAAGEPASIATVRFPWRPDRA